MKKDQQYYEEKWEKSESFRVGLTFAFFFGILAIISVFIIILYFVFNISIFLSVLLSIFIFIFSVLALTAIYMFLEDCFSSDDKGLY